MKPRIRRSVTHSGGWVCFWKGATGWGATPAEAYADMRRSLRYWAAQGFAT